MDGWMDGWVGGWVVRWMDGWMGDGWMDIDRQIHANKVMLSW